MKTANRRQTTVISRIRKRGLSLINSLNAKTTGKSTAQTTPARRMNGLCRSKYEETATACERRAAVAGRGRGAVLRGAWRGREGPAVPELELDVDMGQENPSAVVVALAVAFDRPAGIVSVVGVTGNMELASVTVVAAAALGSNATHTRPDSPGCNP